MLKYKKLLLLYIYILYIVELNEILLEEKYGQRYKIRTCSIIHQHHHIAHQQIIAIIRRCAWIQLRGKRDVDNILLSY